MNRRLFHGDNYENWQQQPPDKKNGLWWTSDPFDGLTHALESARKFSSNPLIVVHHGKKGVIFEFQSEVIGAGNRAKHYRPGPNSDFSETDDFIEVFHEDHFDDYINKYLPKERERAQAYLEHYKKRKNAGFALIALVIALAVIAIWASLYFARQKQTTSVIQTGNQAIEQTKQNNTLLDNQQIEIQKNLNALEK